jgi:carboxyl-terminal processing protease
VHDVVAGSSAAAAGILRGDRILHVDGAAPEDAGLRPSPWDVGLGGPRSYFLPVVKDKSLLLELQRRAEATKPGYNTFQVRVAPRPWNLIEAERASAKLVERGPGLRLGYVRMYHFLSEDVVDVLASLLINGPLDEADGLIVDLRGKGGLPSVVDRTIALFDKRCKTGPVYGRPVVAITDSETRSAKEMCAWQWKNLGIGPVVGERTRGAVVGSRFIPLPDGAFLVLASTDMRCCTGGIVLEGHGVEPDVYVKDELPYAQGADPLRARAEEVLLERVLQARRGGQHGWY